MPPQRKAMNDGLMSDITRIFFVDMRRATIDALTIWASFNGFALPATAQQVASQFSSEDCVVVTRLLVKEMQAYTPVDGDSNSALSSILPNSAKSFIGVDREPKEIACNGPRINWSTGGDKAVLNAVSVQISIAEQEGLVGKGATQKFRAVISKNPVVSPKLGR
jgi:hypothetical protein